MLSTSRVTAVPLSADDPSLDTRRVAAPSMYRTIEATIALVMTASSTTMPALMCDLPPVTAGCGLCRSADWNRTFASRWTPAGSC
jgi:hypothetical protein